MKKKCILFAFCCSKVCICQKKAVPLQCFYNICKDMSEESLQKVSAPPENMQSYADVCHIIDEMRTRVAVYVNSEVCHTNWLIGKRIKEDVLFNRRADYGKEVIKIYH